MVLILGVVLFVGFRYLDLGGFRLGKRKGDVTVRRMYQHIHVGATRQDVLEVFWRDKQFGSMLDTNATGVWTVFTYGTRTFRSWLLVVEFQDDRVSAVKVRNVDGVNPRSAPMDKTSDGSR